MAWLRGGGEEKLVNCMYCCTTGTSAFTDNNSKIGDIVILIAPRTPSSLVGLTLLESWSGGSNIHWTYVYRVTATSFSLTCSNGNSIIARYSKGGKTVNYSKYAPDTDIPTEKDDIVDFAYGGTSVIHSPNSNLRTLVPYGPTADNYIHYAYRAKETANSVISCTYAQAVRIY